MLKQRIENPKWHAMKAEAVLGLLEARPQGLTSEEAAERLRRLGPNQLKETPRPNFLTLMWQQLNSFVVILLVVASVLAALLGDHVEAAAIIAIVSFNALMGIVQEQRAEKALEALKKLSAPDAQVLRDGTRHLVPAHTLVPGDVVFLETGNFIPADLRLLEAVNLRVEEASLTGESLPVQKTGAAVLEKDVPLGDRKNIAFMGTTVSYGRGRGVVTDTGMHTQLGLIATMLQQVEGEQTPLQRRLDALGRLLSVASLILVAMVFLVALYNQTDIGLLFTHPKAYAERFAATMSELFIIAISLAIAAVPEGLPAVVTISLALGMREMIRRHALIRKLSSVETLGSATTICSDKTGTLTQNEMTVTRLWADGQFVTLTGTGYAPIGELQVEGRKIDQSQYPAILSTLWLGLLNNDALLETTGESQSTRAYRIAGDPTEGALLVAAAKAGALHMDVTDAYPRKNEVPFDSERKRMITVHDVRNPKPGDPSPFYDQRHRSWHVIAVKGAPDIVLDLCTRYLGMDDRPRAMSPEAHRRILDANDRMTRDALRVIGLAYRVVEDVPDDEAKIHAEELEKDLVFVGLAGMIDPPRPQVEPALAHARQAGIRTIMITGDYPDTAKAVAGSIGLLRPGGKVITGPQLDELTDAQLERVIEETDVFARVSAEHKMRIVNALQANDEIVAMTGDGVNDAPAIRRADIGVAMGITGTDVVKETADMVLTDDNYASIVAAVEQGRIIYSNIRKFVFFLLSSNVAEITIIFLATLAGLPMPLTAIQLLWLNLITDGAPALALALEKGDPDIMTQKPRPKSEPIVNRAMAVGIVIQTVAQTGAVLGAFVTGLVWSLTQADMTPPVGESVLSFVLSRNWQGVDTRAAGTMAFATLSIAELFRAYTVRSERASLFKIGVFSNPYMQYAVGFSILLLLTLCTTPLLQPIFNTRFLTGVEWAVVLALSLIPAAAEETTKFFLRANRQRQRVHPTLSPSA